MMNIKTACSVVESLLFASSTPLSVADLSKVTGIDEETVTKLIDEVRLRLEDGGHGIQIVRVAGGYQMATVPENAYFVSQLQHVSERTELSPAALETLAVVAYKQPITRSEIESIRGVQCGRVLAGLVERGLIAEVGRKEAVGRPILYGTTEIFLRCFGLGSIEELPDITRFGEDDTQLVSDLSVESEAAAASEEGILDSASGDNSDA